MKRNFTKEVTQRANKHMESPTSLSIIEMHIKSTSRYVHMSTQWQK